MMKQITLRIVSLCFLLAIAMPVFSAVRQPVCLNVYIPEDESIPMESAKVLENKLLQIATSNTLSSMGRSSRFFLSAHVSAVSKDIIPSNPPRISQKLSVILYIGDVIEDVVYATETIELLGIGTNEAKAYNTAFQKLNVKNLNSFLGRAFEKIEAYYEKNYEKHLNEAKMLESRKDYNGALMIVSELMSTCDSHTEECTSLWNKIYKEQVDFEAEQCLYRAKNIWSTTKNEAGAQEAIEILCAISPDAASIKYANSLVDEIEHYISSSKQVQAKELKKKYDDELELKRAELKTKTVADQAVTYQEQNGIIDLKKVTRVIKSWFE